MLDNIERNFMNHGKQKKLSKMKSYHRMNMEPVMEMMNPIMKAQMMMMMNKDNMIMERKVNSILTPLLISIVFKIPNAEPIVIKCQKKERIFDIIEKYRNISGDNLKKIFLYNGKSLNSLNCTIEELDHLNSSLAIDVIQIGESAGSGIPMKFNDLSKKNTKKIGFSKNAPSYRGITKGINIFGICKCTYCKAYNNEVVVMIKKKIIDLVKERDELFCPECGSLIIPKTVGFHLCEYKIYGYKLENGRSQRFNNPPGKAKDKNNLTYFDNGLNGEVMFTELIIEVL